MKKCVPTVTNYRIDIVSTLLTILKDIHIYFFVDSLLFHLIIFTRVVCSGNGKRMLFLVVERYKKSCLTYIFIASAVVGQIPEASNIYLSEL